MSEVGFQDWNFFQFWFLVQNWNFIPDVTSLQKSIRQINRYPVNMFFFPFKVKIWFNLLHLYVHSFKSEKI